MSYPLAATYWLGLASVAKTEIKSLGGTTVEVTDRMTRFTVENNKDIAKMCLDLSTVSRLYLELWEGECTTWDQLFEITKSLDWEKYVPMDWSILVRAVSEKSSLTSLPSLQGTVKKGIIHVLSWGAFVREDERNGILSVLVLARGNRVSILLDLVGDPLHKRGYRLQAGEAPLKETLAAAMLRLCWYRGETLLLDPVCGSGTIAIEAARIARNIPAGYNRSFILERFLWYPIEHFISVRDTAKADILPRTPTRIIASDIDAGMISIARENATKAGVGDDIELRIQSIEEYRSIKLEGTIVANPPYGIRLGTDDAATVHRTLSSAFGYFENLRGAVITPDLTFLYERKHDKNSKHLKVSNGDMNCYIWYRV